MEADGNQRAEFLDHAVIDQLVQWAQDGDEEARLAVLQAFDPLVRATAARYRDVAYEDAAQEGYVALLACLTTYDAARGVSFAAYAAAHVRGDVRTAMRRLWLAADRSVALQDYDGDSSSGGDGDFGAISAAGDDGWDGGSDSRGGSGSGGAEAGTGPSEGVFGGVIGGGIAGVELRMMLESARLSPREALSIRGMLMGLSCAEIAQREGVSAETVKTWRKRAFRKVRAVWER